MGETLHQHGHGHSHAHGLAASRAGERHRRPLTIALALIVAFLVVQVAAAFATDSLALLSDAGHMATDALGLGMALAAVHAAARGSRNPQRTFGHYRLEILAALANAALLIGVGVYVLIEAVLRIGDAPEVASGPMLVVGVVGLAVNLIAFWLLRAGAKVSLNLRGAYLEVVSDALGSLGVIIAAAVIAVTGWDGVDAIIGAAIGAFIIPRSIRLGRDALRVLMQAAPHGIEVEAVRADLAAIPGVVDVHDVHVWTLTSEMDVASAHVMIGAGTDAHSVLDQARHLLRERYRLTHATLQIEPDDHTGCDQVTW